MHVISKESRNSHNRFYEYDRTIKKYSKDKGCFIDSQKEVIQTCTFKEIRKGKVLNLQLYEIDKND